MKKRLVWFLFIAVVLVTGTLVLASAEDYSLFIDYNQNIIKGVPVKADVKLIGNNAPAHSNVRVKVDISGPATPKIMAVDSQQHEWDIAQLGYWGAEEGFAVGGTFTNVTPVTATFPEAGLYEITLTLIDVSTRQTNADPTVETAALPDGSTILTTEKQSVYVYNDQAELDAVLKAQNELNTTNNTVNTANTVENLPKTGTSLAEYVIYAGIIIAICLVGYMIIRKYRVNL